MCLQHITIISYMKVGTDCSSVNFRNLLEVGNIVKIKFLPAEKSEWTVTRDFHSDGGSFPRDEDQVIMHKEKTLLSSAKDFPINALTLMHCNQG